MDTPPPSSSAISPSYLLISLLCCLPLLPHGNDGWVVYQICGDTGNYTANSTYESNLHQLLPYLSSVASVSNVFSDASRGKSLYQAFGLALFRGDVNSTYECRTRLNGAFSDILQLHPYSKTAVIGHDDCFFNYSNLNFASASNNSEQVLIWNNQNVTGWSGYMSPEYASEGLFSVKSDVFSFGVLLLEIVSGKRNAGFHRYGNHLNLLGYAWELWNEGRWFELIDPSIDGSSERNEILRCIHVALMCVQENATDRPTMSDVIAMLSSDSTSLPDPKQPAYFDVRINDETEMASNVIMPVSKNEITSSLEGR
uniref:Gnk2-homologous domain-containing protein n=1 Tax=Ananas comosus var. bracteatus TaxID=296719 RepID=A0A6V7NL14_ANACO|nr:unnamed protein product [Ananas comosus var. bracteatus]